MKRLAIAFLFLPVLLFGQQSILVAPGLYAHTNPSAGDAAYQKCIDDGGTNFTCYPVKVNAIGAEAQNRVTSIFGAFFNWLSSEHLFYNAPNGKCYGECMALALDGSVHSTLTSLALTTSNANDDIVAIVTINGATVASISSTNTTGWALRKRQATGAGSHIEEWVGTAANALSSETIAITTTGGETFTSITIFGISGADTSTIFDGNGALPDGQTTSTASITTSNANDFLIGAYRFGNTASPTAGSGWTAISGADFMLVEYKIVAATQSALSVTIGTGNGDQNAGIGDAIKQSGGGAPSDAQEWLARSSTVVRRPSFNVGY